MAEKNNKGNFDRKVIPYDRSIGNDNTANNQDTIQSSTGDRDTKPYPMGLRDMVPEDTEQLIDEDLAQNTAEPIGQGMSDVEQDDTEFAEEAAHWGPRIDGDNSAEAEDDQAKGEGYGWGIVGLILSFLGIFIWPVVFATAGIIVGYIAFRNGARAMGTWSMVIGAFALLMALFMLPAYFR